VLKLSGKSISIYLRRCKNSTDGYMKGVLKDVNSSGQGVFYPIKVDSNDYSTAYLYFNGNLIIVGLLKGNNIIYLC
jgi:hypothetical protein